MKRWDLLSLPPSTRKRRARQPGADAPRVAMLGCQQPRVLFSDPECRVVVVDLCSGEGLGDHQVRERAVVEVITGRILVECSGETCECEAGALLVFDPGEQHAVRALVETRLLMMLAPWPGAGHNTESEAGHAHDLPVNAVAVQAALPATRTIPTPQRMEPHMETLEPETTTTSSETPVLAPPTDTAGSESPEPASPPDASGEETDASVTHRDIAEWQGKELVDCDGETIGRLERVYFDIETDEPQFGTVKEGFIGRHLAFVPLTGATIGPDNVQVTVSRNQVKGAPTIQREGDELSQAEESALYHRYHLNYTATGTKSGQRLARH